VIERPMRSDPAGAPSLCFRTFDFSEEAIANLASLRTLAAPGRHGLVFFAGYVVRAGVVQVIAFVGTALARPGGVGCRGPRWRQRRWCPGWRRWRSALDPRTGKGKSQPRFMRRLRFFRSFERYIFGNSRLLVGHCADVGGRRAQNLPPENSTSDN
jgi:hypothetical protein